VLLWGAGMIGKKRKNIVISGGGTAGSIIANRLADKLNDEYVITVIDRDDVHYYQPGFLFIPFGIYGEKDVIMSRRKFISEKVSLVYEEVQKILPDENRVILGNDSILSYDVLVIASGSTIVPDETKGMTEGWRKNIFDFYTLDGALALRDVLEKWEGGSLVMHISEMPIKCPIAPLEFVFMADWWLKKKGLRDKTDIHYITPLAGAFTREIASSYLGSLLRDKGISIYPDFVTEKIDSKKRKIISYDGRTIIYDLLVAVPVNMGDGFAERSGIGDDLNFIPTDPYTLQSKKYKNIFIAGDATNVPTSKAGAVAHFQGERIIENIINCLNNEDPVPVFDGHANCFLETGYKKGVLLDFNYEVEPLPGRFPFSIIGPFSLLKESILNHMGKLLFRWVYWHVILRGRNIPFVSPEFDMKGKKRPEKNESPGD